MPINLDFGDVGKIPDEGTYLVKVKTATIEKGPQAPYIKLNFEICGPTMMGYSNLWLNLSVAQQSLWATQRDLEALTGYDYKDDNMMVDEHDLPGLMCGAIIEHGEWESRAKPEITRLVPLSVAEEALANWTEPEPVPSSETFSFGSESASAEEEPF